MRPECNEQNAFSVKKVSPEEKKDLLFVASTMQILKYFSDIFKSKRTDLLKAPFLKAVIKVLSDLVFFILDL